MKRAIAFYLIPLLALAAPSHAVRIEQDGDYSLYDNILVSYVNAEGLVDYAGLRANSLQDLTAVVDQFAKAELKSMEYPEKLAFWINAYNANVLKSIAEHPDMKKVTDHPDLFDAPLTVAKGRYSLNDILHRILRGKANPKTGEGPIRGVTLDILDPRIHFALCGGARGGPSLQNFAYTSKNLEQSLRKNSIDFVNSSDHLRLEQGRLFIADLFNRYAEDFDQWGGPASYINRLLDPHLRPDGAALKKLILTDYRKAEFISDPTLNDLRNALLKTKNPRR